MASSKDMQPVSSPFFPHIFFKNQFGTEPTWPPKDTNLTGKVAIVTGANQGLGLEASDQLLSLRLSRLIIAVRSAAKGEAAAGVLRAKYPKATIDVFQLDMSSYDSIRSFVAQVERLERVDIAILNAGVRKSKLKLVPGTGHEETIQVNYISTALLCILLLPVLKSKSVGGPGQISIVSSGLAFLATFRNRMASPLLSSFDDIKNFDADRYNTSKLLGMMFIYKLVDYVSADDVVVNIVDPGFVKGTGLSRSMSFVEAAVMAPFKQIAARPLKVGASTYVDAAVVKGKESHGSYIMSWKISPFAGLLYTPEGKQVIDRLWQETIAELSFAGVQGILDGLKKV
ncbi:NAD(P)-binding protein [Hypoxylon sp. NC1633]|nr:NAD(P)-binding protein [Hypoxylon sp. NC1633]